MFKIPLSMPNALSPAIGEAVFFVFENHKILSKRAQVIVQKRVDISDLIIKLFFF